MAGESDEVPGDRSATQRDQAPAAGEQAEPAGDRERARDDLEALSTKELHDRAVRRAERHLDVRFFWSLLRLIPAAQAASGDEGEADYDIQSSKGLIYDALHSGDGRLGEALRPLFLDYLREHPDA
jgi:hypothetical protein